MPSKRDSFPDHKSYDSGNIRLERTAIRLVCLLLADKALKQACWKYDLVNLHGATTETEDWEAVQLTVDLASGYRLIHWNSRNRVATKPVGTLWRTAGVDLQESLSVVEAANKVIHANQLQFHEKKIRNRPDVYLEPFLFLSGQKGRTQWEAEIDILLFCNEVLAPHGNPFVKPEASSSAASGA